MCSAGPGGRPRRGGQTGPAGAVPGRAHAPWGQGHTGLSMFVPGVQPGLTQKEPQRRLLRDPRTDPLPGPSPLTVPTQVHVHKGTGLLCTHVRGKHGPARGLAGGAGPSPPLSSLGPSPFGLPRRDTLEQVWDLAGGWENEAHSAKGKHLTQP